MIVKTAARRAAGAMGCPWHAPRLATTDLDLLRAALDVDVYTWQ